MLGEIGLLLVEVDRDQLEAHRRLLAQLQQDVEHRVAVLAAGQAHHHLVAVLDHAEVGDRAAHLVAQALGQAHALVLAAARARLGLEQGERDVGHAANAAVTASSSCRAAFDLPASRALSSPP